MVYLSILTGGAMVLGGPTASCHSDPFTGTDAITALRMGEPTVARLLATVARLAMVLS
jgi:hypothetical protein